MVYKRYTRKQHKKKHRGGKGGIMDFFYEKPTSESLIAGAGGYGVVLETGNYVVKLLKDINDCPALIEEASLQISAQKAIQQAHINIHIPAIYKYETSKIKWKNNTYLCGIVMERVPAFDTDGQMHMILGDSDENDLNRIVGVQESKPVNSINLARGFYASPSLLEDIWKERSSKWTIDSVAYIMGQTYRALIDAHIVPNDLEFIYGADDTIWCIDFGLCRFGNVDPATFLNKKGVEGIGSEIYVPQDGCKGRQAFLNGFIKTP